MSENSEVEASHIFDAMQSNGRSDEVHSTAVEEEGRRMEEVIEDIPFERDWHLPSAK